MNLKNRKIIYYIVWGFVLFYFYQEFAKTDPFGKNSAFYQEGCKTIKIKAEKVLKYDGLSNDKIHYKTGSLHSL